MEDFCMFWDKYCKLCEKNGIKPRKLAYSLGMSPTGVNRWLHGSVPNHELLEQIAAYFGVTTDYLIGDEEYFITTTEKRSTFKKLTSLPQRWNSLHAGYDIPKTRLIEFTDFLNCSVFYLTNAGEVTYIPEKKLKKKEREALRKEDILFDILDIMDACADTDSYRSIQIQISRIVLYHLNNAGFDREKISAINSLSTSKLDFLYTGEENKDVTLNYGLNFSDLSAIRHEMGLSYWDMLTGAE